jgi:hypothetical protein
MTGVGFELTIPVFEQSKTFRASDRAASVWVKYSLVSYRNEIHNLFDTFMSFKRLQLGWRAPDSKAVW